MDDIQKSLESLKIIEHINEDNAWMLELIQKNFVPQKTVGVNRPCEEEDYRDYRIDVDKNLHGVKSLLERISNNCRHLDNATELAKTFGINLLLLIGEHSEENVWNTPESVSIAKDMLAIFCELYTCQSLSHFLVNQENFSNLLLTLRPKLLKDTWKTYPSAVTCYKWILQDIEKPALFNHIADVLPTALIIIDDFIPDNVVIGLTCIHHIIQHSHLKKGLLETGYAGVIYNVLQNLTYKKEIKYVIPLYHCIANLLATIEHWDHTINLYEWTTRDQILAALIENMKFEQNIELRHAYMSSLPRLLTNIGSAKWCQVLVSIFVEYSGHHTDLRTLKVTLETAKMFLLMFHLRVVAHCKPLYVTFLRLHDDLIETPVFDKEIIQNLEDCIYILNRLTPGIGYAIMNDDRLRTMIRHNLQVADQGDIKYFE